MARLGWKSIVLCGPLNTPLTLNQLPQAELAPFWGDCGIDITDLLVQ